MKTTEMLFLLFLLIIVDHIQPIHAASGSSSIANAIKYRLQRPDKFINERKEKVGNYDGVDTLDDESKSVEK